MTNDVDRITPIDRRRGKDQHKWAVPGGLFGVTGWKSTLYKHVPYGTARWVDNIPVWNGTNYQNNRGWVRSYADGAMFVDVLTNEKTGKVFEARIAEKHEGKWERYVAYKDVTQRPPGYHGLQMKCVACHNNVDGPGTGGYAEGLVPGSDTVVSDPFPELER